MFKGAIDFCIFTLYLSSLLNSFISVNGVLIGETLMRADNKEKMLKELDC